MCEHLSLVYYLQMFEHMKNYKLLMAKVASWLRPNSAEESLFFVHIFCHKTTPYHFVEDDGWMSKTFFSGTSVMLRPHTCIDQERPKGVQ